MTLACLQYTFVSVVKPTWKAFQLYLHISTCGNIFNNHWENLLNNNVELFVVFVQFMMHNLHRGTSRLTGDAKQMAGGVKEAKCPWRKEANVKKSKLVWIKAVLYLQTEPRGNSKGLLFFSF